MYNVNYLSFIQTLESFAARHLEVKRFHSDFLDQLQNFGSKGESYPLLYVAPASYQFKNNNMVQSRFNDLTVNIYCIDLQLADRSNVNNILNTTSCILNDLFKWLAEGNANGVDVVNVSPLKPLNNYTLESAVGWMMTLTVNLESYSVCDIPLGPTPSGGGTGGGGTGGTGGTGNPYPDPGLDGWQLNYSIFPGVQTTGGNDCEWQMLNGLAQNNIQFQEGIWQTVIPQQLENEVRYFGSIPRTFDVSVGIAMSTPQPSNIEYSFRKSEGFTGSQGYFEPIPQATGVVTVGGSAHPVVTFQTTWTPSVQGDLFGLTMRFCGEAAQTATLTYANVTIVQQPVP